METDDHVLLNEIDYSNDNYSVFGDTDIVLESCRNSSELRQTTTVTRDHGTSQRVRLSSNAYSIGLPSVATGDLLNEISNWFEQAGTATTLSALDSDIWRPFMTSSSDPSMLQIGKSDAELTSHKTYTDFTSSAPDRYMDMTDDISDTESDCHNDRLTRRVQLWQFLKELLSNPSDYHYAIDWVDQSQGIFKIKNSCTVAKLWGQRKNRPSMNYDKLSRSIRQYYKKGIIRKTCTSRRLIYQFCPKYI